MPIMKRPPSLPRTRRVSSHRRGHRAVRRLLIETMEDRRLLAIAGPYPDDANTLHLWHLDEANPGPAVPAAGVTGSFNLAAVNGATLGNASFAGFGTAADISGGADDGLQGSNISVNSVTGANGAFTIEALINVPEINTKQGIVMMDAPGALNVRPFQFALQSGNLQFLNLAPGNQPGLQTAIPTTGDDAFVANEWFHVAVTYNGTENTADNFKLYWTAVDAARTQANEILSTNMNNDLGASAVFGVGQEFRSPSENLLGLIDEVRVSDIARGANEFLFAPPAPEINVQGLGVDIVSGDTTPAVADDTDFGTAAVGAADIVHTFTIQNSGDAELDVTAVTISGSSDFTVSGPTDPIARYALDGNALDSSGNNSHGVVSNATFVNDPARGMVASFNGTNSSIDVSASNYSITERPNFEFAISFWFKPTARQDYVPGGAIDVNPIMGGTNSGVIEVVGHGSWGGMGNATAYGGVGVNSGGGAGSTAKVNSIDLYDGDWHQVVIQWQDPDGVPSDFTLGGSADATIYIDNQLAVDVNSQTYNGNSGQATPTMVLGGPVVYSNGGPANKYYDGLMSDVRFFDGQLTPQDVDNLFNQAATFDVAFAPTTVGTQTATVTIANNDSDEGTYTFDVKGLVQSTQPTLDAVDDDYTVTDPITEDQTLNIPASGVLQNDSPSPVVADIVAVGENSTSDTFFDSSASSNDLINAGQGTFLAAATTVNPTFGFGGLNNGVAAGTTTDSAFYRNSEQPASVTFTLDTSVNANGYDIQTVRTLAGWTGANQTQANQKYEFLTRQVGTPGFISHGIFEEAPFSASTTAASSTRITIMDGSGLIAANVDAVRFNLIYAGALGNNANPGTVYREFDVEGLVSAGPPTSSAAAIISFDAISANGAVVTLNGDGSFSYDPSGLQSLDEGDVVTDTFSYTITDGSPPVAPLPGADADLLANVPAAASYSLAYDLSIPDTANFRGGTAIPYATDNSALLTGYSRIGYYLELETAATSEWVFVTM
ncbi:MAG: hypothetical protein ACI9HK_006328, partial [Pirellulaceae bacterium]